MKKFKAFRWIYSDFRVGFTAESDSSLVDSFVIDHKDGITIYDSVDDCVEDYDYYLSLYQLANQDP